MTSVQMIPIGKVRVINARVRNKVKFQEIVTNISKLGLKKPITVARRTDGEDGFDLVCGQARLNLADWRGRGKAPAARQCGTARPRLAKREAQRSWWHSARTREGRVKGLSTPPPVFVCPHISIQHLLCVPPLRRGQ
jgi:hypothetical protein